MWDMREKHEETSTMTVHTSAATTGRSSRQRVSREHTLHDQVRNLRMALSDLKIQVSDFATAFVRTPSAE